MSDGSPLRDVTFTQPALTLGVANLGPEHRLALAVLIGPGADRIGDDVLEYDIPGVDLSGVRTNRVPVLREHFRRLEYVLGGVADAWIEDGVLKAILRFARGPEADPVWELIAQGFPVNVSIGSKTLATEDGGPSLHGGRVYRVTAWRLKEISIVAQGQRPEACVSAVDPERLRELAARMPAAEDAARLEVRRRLRLDRWDRWAMTAGIRLAQELGVDVDRLGDALAREVKEHAAALERDNAAPRLAERAA